jgi:hypothetical protein
LGILRDRIGKCPSDELIEARHIEELGSQRRKLAGKVREKQETEKALVQQLRTDPHYTKYCLWEKHRAVAFLPRIEAVSATGSEEARAEATQLYNLLKGFCAQDRFSDLSEYLEHQHSVQLNRVNALFLSKMGINPQELYLSDQKADAKEGHSPGKNWEDLSEADKRPLLDNYAFRVSYEKYRLEVSDWHPEKGPRHLIEVLQDRGPMYVKGYYGPRYYIVDPRQVEEIAGRSVWGWNRTDPRRELTVAHSIIVVGAKIDSPTNAFVYFVDPQDGSDPSSIETQRIYKMSYANFIKRIGDLRNRILLKEGSDEVAYSHDIGYGLHHSHHEK